MESFFSLPFTDADGIGIHHTLPSGSLLEAADVLEQFLSADDPLEEPDLNGPATLHCEICKKKFDNAKRYYGHLRVHSKDNLWICDKCPDQKFSTKQQLMKHGLTHKPLERVWKCPQCPMAFEALWRLQQHLFAKHLNYRPHKCNECNKTFGKLSDLNKHKDIHSDNRKNKCSECGLAMMDKSNLKRHLLTHTNEKNFRCDYCGNGFTQSASMKRHMSNCSRRMGQRATANSQEVQTVMHDAQAMGHEVHSMVPCDAPAQVQYAPVMSTPLRQNSCRVCGMQFQYKSALLEHCVRVHTNNSESLPKERDDKSALHPHVTDNKTYDSIVDDILSVEDDYSIINVASTQTQSDIFNIANYSKTSENISGQAEDKNTDTLMQMEFLKEMNQLHSLDDELFYNDIDFDSFQANQVFSSNDIDCRTQDRNAEILFDFADGNRSIDQDIMNALYQNKSEHIPDELLNVPPKDPSAFPAPTISESMLPDSVTVNECSTIFESDVDLEASTNLAMNLNQLIGENSVQYVSTEDDDTFIINLDSGIDAEKLSDLLNIGVEMTEGNTADAENKTDEKRLCKDSKVPETEPIVIIIENSETRVVDENNLKKKTENEVNKAQKPQGCKKKEAKTKHSFVCKKCKKVFKKKDNYISHVGTHLPAHRRHRCLVCSQRFSYRSTLNKHSARCHEPLVLPEHRCTQCHRLYTANWMLQNHIERDHARLKPFACTFEGCTSRFYKKHDLDIHKRFHTGERPYKCEICSRCFAHRSHLKRHARTVDCTKLANEPKKIRMNQPKPTNVYVETVQCNQMSVASSKHRNKQEGKPNIIVSIPKQISVDTPKLEVSVDSSELSYAVSVDGSEETGVNYIISDVPFTFISCGPSLDDKRVTEQISLLRTRTKKNADCPKRTSANCTKQNRASKEQKTGMRTKLKTVCNSNLKSAGDFRHNKMFKKCLSKRNKITRE